MEGNIADVPDLGGEKFSDCFFVFRDMPENLDFPELVGVNILKVYAVEVRLLGWLNVSTWYYSTN